MTLTLNAILYQFLTGRRLRARGHEGLVVVAWGSYMYGFSIRFADGAIVTDLRWDEEIEVVVEMEVIHIGEHHGGYS